MVSAMGQEGGGEEVTEAVEEQKMSFGGCWPCGDESARRRMLCRPWIWSLTNERKLARKLTAQAAWTTLTAFAARET